MWVVSRRGTERIGGGKNLKRLNRTMGEGRVIAREEVINNHKAQQCGV